MRKADLVEKVMGKVDGVSSDKVSKIVNAVFDTIAEGLADGDSYSQDNFGTFKAVERAARKGRNPQTGDEIAIPAKAAVKLVVSKNLKELVNKDYK